MSGVSFVLDKPVSQYPTITTNPKEEVMHKTRNENQFNKARRDDPLPALKGGFFTAGVLGVTPSIAGLMVLFLGW